MKNKYSPISDSDDSSKTLNDEKADSRSSPSDGTPPPYTASNKFIDLEMADGSAQNSAQESVNNTRSDPSTNEEWWKNFSVGIMTIIAILYNTVFLAIVFGYKVSPYTNVFYGLAGGSIGSIFIFLFMILVTYPEWYRQAGRATKKVLKKSGRATKKVAPAVCKALIILISLNGVGGYVLKLSGGFEYIHSAAMLVVLAVLNICFFVLLIHNPDAIEDHVPTRLNRISRNGPPRNEEIELQPLAEQSANV
ncbi:wtf meiotic driver [Schizosaccharomyces osmophilus]|uniref:Wtf meiotic driver n=1 Tax=Schizosaccharomyces osmophilus TaxID=2545709 RepID=A0AAF0AWE1_9SCHI|nr:wtf meiotic driver [Schizosaccharomyces osmophilus]WBW73517.1 wtf meiotic driver [Schizosaccharomyces osmophilus]